MALLAALGGASAGDAFAARVVRLFEAMPAAARAAVGLRLQRFAEEVESTGRPFAFDDCSLGNLVFAGGFLLAARDFNRAVDDYCALVGLPPGLIENVTDGTNAYLVALDSDERLLATEEAIVDAARPNRIRDIFLIDRPLTADEIADIEARRVDAVQVLNSRQPRLVMNPRVAEKIASAALIIYGPGTQHSSLFPSYLTPGLGDAVAGNLTAMKVLVTNLQPDAEITGSNAVDLVERAVFFLRAKNHARIPTPFLVTHSLLNDPSVPEATRPYVPLGPTDTIEDPRLVRIGNYEDGVTGRHHAARVLEPFISSIVSRRERRRVAVLLSDTASLNKVTQTLLEMVRGGIEHVPLDVTVFYTAPEPLDPRLAARLPLELHYLRDGERAFAAAARDRGFDYVLLFESSGMYRGRRDGSAAVAARDRAARRGVGQSPPVGPRHRGVLPLSLQRERLRRHGQLSRQLRAEPGVSHAVRPLHHRHAVGRSGDPGRRRARSARRSRAQEREPRAALAPAAAQGGNPGDSGPIRPARARSREADQRCRGHARARDPRDATASRARPADAAGDSRMPRSLPRPSAPSNEVASADCSRGRSRHAPGRDPAEAARPGRRHPDDRPSARALR